MPKKGFELELEIWQEQYPTASAQISYSVYSFFAQQGPQGEPGPPGQQGIPGPQVSISNPYIPTFSL